MKRHKEEEKFSNKYDCVECGKGFNKFTETSVKKISLTNTCEYTKILLSNVIVKIFQLILKLLYNTFVTGVELIFLCLLRPQYNAILMSSRTIPLSIMLFVGAKIDYNILKNNKLC